MIADPDHRRRPPVLPAGGPRTAAPA